MNAAIWAELASRLGFALFERTSETAYLPVGDLPQWFLKVCPAAAVEHPTIDLATHIPFLEVFIPEADEYWSGVGQEPVKSGLCTEVDSAGVEYHYEVTAFRLDGSPYLLFEHRKDWVEMREILQKARTNLLDYELLERTRRALERSQAELRTARDVAESATRAKSAFLAHMSHEIRTPMNAVLGLTGLVLKTQLDGRQKELLDIVKNSAETLLTILNDILDFSKIESGKLELERQPFEIRRCVEESMDLFAVKAAEKNIEMSAFTSPDLPGMMIGDVTRLRQVLVNLLGNAIKFTGSGEISITTTGRTLGPGTWELSFAVRDSGIGIPPEKRDRLFQSFSQVDASITRKYGGTGLGLSICKSLVELMGGRIWVEGAPDDVGSVFRFTANADESAADSLDYAAHSPADLKGKRAWLVGFNGTHLKLLQEQLGWWGLRVECAESECDVTIVNSGPGLAVEDLQRLPLPIVEFIPGGRISEPRNMQRLVSLPRPIKPSTLYATLRHLFNPSLSAASTPASADVAAAAPLSDLRILLVDDNSINQKVGLLILESLGYTADVAGNGLEAIDAVHRQQYDVILMDVHMPEMDGWEASRRIRSESTPASQTRIVAMTAGILEEERQKCVDAGMEDFVSKPIRAEQLKKVLEKKGRAVQPQTAVAGAAAADGADFDPETLRALRALNKPGGPDIVEKLMKAYRLLLPKELKAIQTAAADGQSKALEEAAHRLRGSSANMGATAIASVCGTLEAFGKSGSTKKVPDAVRQLEECVERVLKAPIP